MRRLNRSLMTLFVSILLAAGLFGAMASARLAAESSAPVAAGDPHILSYQKPRLQAFSAGNDATFTISITNTGPITLQTVTVTGATSPDCNRGNLGPLEPGEYHEYECERDNVFTSFLNGLQVNGTAAGQPPVSHKSNAYVKVWTPEIRITKNPAPENEKEPPTQVVSFGDDADFMVRLFNTSVVSLNVLSVDDNLVEDCDFTANPGSPTVIGPSQTIFFPCTMENVQEPMTTIITVKVVESSNTQGPTYTATDASWVEVLKLDATLTPGLASVAEPGGPVPFTVDLVNTGSVGLTPATLTTDAFGDLLNPGNPLLQGGENTCLDAALHTLPAYGGAYQCSFVAQVSGQPPSTTINLTATGEGTGGLSTSATADATVAIEDVPASMTLSLTAIPPFISPPGQLVNFNVQVVNTSPADAITVTELEDEFLGDLNGQGSCALPSGAIQPGNSYSCNFSDQVTGILGEQKSRVITAWAASDDTEPELLFDAGTVAVSLTMEPPRLILFPVVTEDKVEPNSSCSFAYPLGIDRQYFFLPPAQYPADQDYFSFELWQPGAVTVDLTSFIPQKGQVSVFEQKDDAETTGANPCGLSRFHDAITTTNHQFVTVELQPGIYYVRIINDGPSNVPTLYGLRVRITSP